MVTCPIKNAERNYRQAIKDGNFRAAANYMAQYKIAIAATYA